MLDTLVAQGTIELGYAGVLSASWSLQQDLEWRRSSILLCHDVMKAGGEMSTQP